MARELAASTGINDEKGPLQAAAAAAKHPRYPSEQIGRNTLEHATQRHPAGFGLTPQAGVNDVQPRRVERRIRGGERRSAQRQKRKSNYSIADPDCGRGQQRRNQQRHSRHHDARAEPSSSE